MMQRLTARLKSLPIAKKLSLIWVLVSLLGLIAVLSAILSYDRIQINLMTEKELTILASVIGNRSSAAIIFDDRQLAIENLKTLTHQPSIVAACLYIVADDSNDRQPLVLAHYPNTSISCPGQTSLISVFIDSENRDFKQLIHPVRLDGTIIAYLYLKSNTEELQQFEKNHLFVSAIIAAIIFLVTLFFANTMSRWITRPLSSLRVTAQKIADDDDYSIRAEKFHSDEVGKVVDAFNQMLEVIEREDYLLRESEEKFRLISSSSKVGIFQIDMAGHCVFANDELAEITGLEKQNILDQNWHLAIHPEDRQLVLRKWNQLLSNGRDIFISCRLQTPDTKWIECTVAGLHNTEGELIAYLGTMHDISEIKKAQAQLEKLAFYDPLTGLANRRLFRNRLEHALNQLNRQKRTLGLVLLDLDNFKEINDSLGHDAGDKLLAIVAERLRLSVRETDTVSRLGGDEFAIILPGINKPLDISRIVENVMSSLREQIELEGSQVRMTASIGITLSPEDGDGAEVLVKNADLALYQAKDKGRNRLQFFTSGMNTKLLNYLQLKDELHHAVDRQDFSLVYQPQIGLKDNSLTGFEALIRWNHETRGIISPVDFIPAAEDTGLIIPIGRWVIKEACQKLNTLIEKKLVDNTVVMTINLSVKQFQDEQLTDFLAATLREHSISPQQFEIEVTESLLMENLDDAIAKLETIKALGILISIDDFGTGYSSLGYLKRLPVDIVKVDRSFVMDIPEDRDDMEITAAVIAMAHGLNYRVVAEGVETLEQLAFLNSKDCDYGQGYLFSRPLPTLEIEEFCRQFPPKKSDQPAAWNIAVDS